MNVVERLGRRKQEARAGLELARQKPLAAPLEEFAVRLGAIAAGLARGGADKLTLLLSPGTAPVGPSIADLLARRTGGIIPIVGEPAGRKDAYGLDRLFVSVSLAGEAHDMTYLAESGHPVVQWALPPEELPGELARWEITAATLAALLEVAPALPEPPAPSGEPSLRANGLALFADAVQAQTLRKAAGTLGAQAAAAPASWIAAHLALAEGCIVLLPRFAQPVSALQGAIRNVTRLACTTAPVPGTALELTAGSETAHRPGALRIHAEDGDAHKLIETIHAALKLISR